MSDTEDMRLIDAEKLKREAYRRFGLSGIKLITLIDEQPTATALNIRYGDKEKSGHEQRG